MHRTRVLLSRKVNWLFSSAPFCNLQTRMSWCCRRSNCDACLYCYTINDPTSIIDHNIWGVYKPESWNNNMQQKYTENADSHHPQNAASHIHDVFHPWPMFFLSSAKARSQIFVLVDWCQPCDPKSRIHSSFQASNQETNTTPCLLSTMYDFCSSFMRLLLCCLKRLISFWQA